jgi:hypothetical protein
MTSETINRNDQYFYPNKMGNILHRALKELLGREAMDLVMREGGIGDLLEDPPPNDFTKSYPFRGVSGITAGLENVYGVEGGRQKAKDLGHLAFMRGIFDFDPMLGIIDMPRRLMPLSMKIRLGMDIFGVVFNRFSDQIVKVGEDEEHYLWIITRCPVCWQRQVTGPACHLATGILEEALSWVSNGREFHVEQTSCYAAGGPDCTIAITKQPLD